MKSEKLNRKEIIDNRLRHAGWNVNDRTRVIREFFVSTGRNIVYEPLVTYGIQFSDYVLLVKVHHWQLSKQKTIVDARTGEEQAKQYVYAIQEEYNCKLFSYNSIPFIYRKYWEFILPEK